MYITLEEIKKGNYWLYRELCWFLKYNPEYDYEEALFDYVANKIFKYWIMDNPVPSDFKANI